MIKEYDGRDIYLRGKAAIDFGIADTVGTPVSSVTHAYKVETIEPKKHENRGKPVAVTTKKKVKRKVATKKKKVTKKKTTKRKTRSKNVR